MSEDEDSYCRLCAEPTAKSQLIAPDEDVGLNSKIATKMLWINIDVSITNCLPNSICFSCFDQLERTWSFLNNVRIAQAKLNEIFLKNVEVEKCSDVKADPDNTGKPVNEDWEAFEALKQEVKPDILNEQLINNDQIQLMTVDPNTLIDLGVVKTERNSHDDDYRPESDGFNTTDSDMPLYQATKKKKMKKKKKLKYHSDDSNIVLNETKQLTWEDYVCICGDCDAQCKNVMSLRIHSLQIHAHCCVFKCADCGKVTSSNKSFLSHVRSHYKFLQDCCEYCNKSFLNSPDLKRHRSESHGEVLKTTCRHCGSIFDNIDLLQDHLVLYSKSNRKRSMKSEKLDLNEELKCDLCEKEFKTRGNLMTHKLVHTERKRNFSCHICGKMFFTKGTLITHLTTHDDTKPFKCEFCPLTFKARGNLQSHISLHSGAKPFVCEQCGKSFRAKRHLKSHSIVHTDLMPYVCNFCKKTFRFKTRLNLHLRQHTGAKPYKCVYCQRDFTNGSNYKKHMKRKHNIDTSRKKYNNVVTLEEIDSSK